MQKVDCFLSKIALFLLFFSIQPLQAEKMFFPIKGLLTVSENPVMIESEFDEKWFDQKSAFEYDHRIARFACILSEVSYVDATKEGNELVKIYKMLGIKDEDIFINYDIDYSNSFGNDQAAFSIAHKGNLVLIVIRGTPKGANEWVSNLNISDSTHDEQFYHEGFRISTERIFPYLRKFIEQHNIDTKKANFLMTGHSRGAAIANILAAHLSSNPNFDTKNIFAYTFATPNVTTTTDSNSEKFGYIWNIENEEDLVQSVPPERYEWKFKKFGRTRILINRWKTTGEKFDNYFYPKMNFYFKQFLERDYEPFEIGSFIPSQFSRIFCKLEKNVEDYYGTMGLRKAEKIFWKVFKDEKSEENTENTENIENIENIENSETKTSHKNNFFKNIVQEMTDMHACETYLSWMMALEEDEAFSTLGSSQLIFDGNGSLAVFDNDGNLMLKIIDGYTRYKSIKKPIFSYTIGGKSVIGIPASEDFTVIVKKNSLIPTPIKISIEHYDERGILVESFDPKKLYPHLNIIYEFEAGSETLQNENIDAKKISKCDISDDMKVKLNKLPNGWGFHISPEISISSKGELTFGLDVGAKNIYTTILYTPKCIMDSRTLSLGVGTNINLFWRLFLDCGFMYNLIWSEDFVAKPQVFTKLSYKLTRRIHLFTGLDFWDDAKFRFGVKF